MTERAIIVKHDPPPIPSHMGCDWCAKRADWDLGDETGFGATEAEAIADLLMSEGMNE